MLNFQRVHMKKTWSKARHFLTIMAITFHCLSGSWRTNFAPREATQKPLPCSVRKYLQRRLGPEVRGPVRCPQSAGPLPRIGRHLVRFGFRGVDKRRFHQIQVAHFEVMHVVNPIKVINHLQYHVHHWVCHRNYSKHPTSI